MEVTKRRGSGALPAATAVGRASDVTAAGCDVKATGCDVMALGGL